MTTRAIILVIAIIAAATTAVSVTVLKIMRSVPLAASQVATPIVAGPKVHWIEGRQLYAGWTDEQPLPPDQIVTDKDGKKITTRPAGWNRWGVDDTIQIGMREDGVVIWRKAEGKK